MEYVEVDGEKIPVLGFGTWQITGIGTKETIKHALDLGYRQIDTAQLYNNEDKVGKAIEEADVDREDVFLTTKIWRTNLRYNDVLNSFEGSLKKLRTDYVDLLLIHWPTKHVPLKNTLQAMNELMEDGKVRHIGVSNFTVDLMRKARNLSKAPLFGNQVEYHPFISQDEILNYCRTHDLLLTAYSPLARGDVLKNEILREIGEKHGKSAAQVTLRWHIQQENVITIPKAAKKEHQRENFNVFDFQLSDHEMERISKLRGSKRKVNPGFAPW